MIKYLNPTTSFEKWNEKLNLKVCVFPIETLGLLEPFGQLRLNKK